MRLAARIFAAFAILSVSASLAAERLLIAGGGFVGKWDTQIDIANPLADPMEVSLSVAGLPLGAPCPPACDGKSYTIPGNGTIRVFASDFLGALYAGPQIIRVDTAPGVPPPSVHARSFSREAASQFAELPIAREASLQALNPTTLVFPGATHLAGVYSNLILQNVGGVATEASLQIFDPAGQQVGSREILVPGDATFRALTIVDVVGSLGAAPVDGGQVRVTRKPGDGVLWGVLTTVVGDGSLEVAVGATP